MTSTTHANSTKHAQPIAVLARPAWALWLAAGVCLVSCASPSSPSPTTESYPAATGQSDSNALDLAATPADGYPLGASWTPPSTPTASATSTGTLTPMPTVVPTQLSALVVDSAAARVYGSLTTGTSADLLIYNAKDARLLDRHPLEPGEVLLGMNGERRRLYVYRPDRGVRLLNADSLESIGNMPLPTPDPSDVKVNLGGNEAPLGPLIRPGTGQVLTFHGLMVTAHDPETGERAWDIALPLSNKERPIYRAAVSDDGRLLYLGVASPHLADWEGNLGTIVFALDLEKRVVLERRDLYARATGWLAWGDSLVVSTDVYKDLGLRHSLWVDGRERRQIFESGLRWIAYDAQRDRLVGELQDKAFDESQILAAADAKTLDLKVVNLSITANGRTTYDPVSDQLYGWSDQIDHLSAIPASSLTDDPPVRPTRVHPVRLAGAHALLPAGRTFGQPPILLALMEITPVPLTTTPPWKSEELIISHDIGASWTSGDAERMTSYRSYGHHPLMSPVFNHDRTLFKLEEGLGVFRSRDGGRSWQPTSVGINGLWFEGFAISPNFASDRTLVATTFRGVQSGSEPLPTQSSDLANQAMPTVTSPATSEWRAGGAGIQATAWRSRDAGDHWEPIGSYSGLLFAPKFAGDRTLMAFGFFESQFYLSPDGGDHWEPRGRIRHDLFPHLVGTRLWSLPPRGDRPRILMALGNGDTEMGGGPHWPESGGVIFRSVDDGWHWDVAYYGGYFYSTLDGTLMGPIPGKVGEMPGWILALETAGNEVLLSRDDGLHWVPAQIADDPEAYPIAVLPDGKILVFGASDGKLRKVSLKAFEDLPTPTPTPN